MLKAQDGIKNVARAEYFNSLSYTFLSPSQVLLLPSSHRFSSRQISVETEPWRVHGRFGPGVDEQIVEQAAKHASAEWSHHWYPKVVTTSTPNLGTVSDRVRHETGAKVSSEVDGVTSLPPMYQL